VQGQALPNTAEGSDPVARPVDPRLLTVPTVRLLSRQSIDIEQQRQDNQAADVRRWFITRHTAHCSEIEAQGAAGKARAGARRFDRANRLNEPPASLQAGGSALFADRQEQERALRLEEDLGRWANEGGVVPPDRSRTPPSPEGAT